jgi:hypothetical protein
MLNAHAQVRVLALLYSICTLVRLLCSNHVQKVAQFDTNPRYLCFADICSKRSDLQRWHAVLLPAELAAHV